MADVTDLEDFGLCRECARPSSAGHAVGCSRDIKAINTPVRYTREYVRNTPGDWYAFAIGVAAATVFHAVVYLVLRT